MLPSSTDCEYFLEVAHSLNLSRAAERLGISQPSLSLAIKRLEMNLGAQLLIRHPHGVALTQNGRQLVGHIVKIINYWQTTKSITLASHSEIQGSYILGCHSTLATGIIAKFLPKLLEKYPKLEIHLKNDISRRILEQLLNFKIDIGILVNPTKYPNLIMRKICQDEIGLWTIRNKRAIHDIESGQGIIVCDPELISTEALLIKLRQKQLKFPRFLTMNSLEVVANLTAKGCGIGILPKFMVQTLYPDILLPIPHTPVFREEIFVVYHQENKNIPAIQAIVRQIKVSQTT